MDFFDRPKRSVSGDDDELSGGSESSSMDLSLQHLEASLQMALGTWSRRVLLACAIQLSLAMLGFLTKFWYVNTVAFLTGFIGIYGAYRFKMEYMFVHLTLVGLAVIKNLLLISLLLDKDVKHTAFVDIYIVILFIDTLINLPFTFYVSYYLYQSLKTSLIGLAFESLEHE